MKQTTIPLRFDLDKIDDNYKIEISNRFETLLACSDEKTPDELWNEIKKHTLEVAKEKIPKSKKKKCLWLSKDTLELIEKRRKLKGKGLQTDNERSEYKFINTEIQKMT